MLSVARLVSFWRCIPMQYNCQKSSNFQGLSHFSRVFGKNDKIPGFFQAGKTVTIFPGFPGAVGTLQTLGSQIVPLNSPLTLFLNSHSQKLCRKISIRKLFYFVPHFDRYFLRIIRHLNFCLFWRKDGR